MQSDKALVTEMCVAATCKKAVELGYKVELVEDGHTTFDWDEIEAVEAIAKHNRHMFALADVKHHAHIKF